jgi:hypothetical protein
VLAASAYGAPIGWGGGVVALLTGTWVMGFTILVIVMGTVLFISSWMTGLNGYAEQLVSSFQQPTNRVEVVMGLIQLLFIYFLSCATVYIAVSMVGVILRVI